jgi:hypothetical protein
MMRRPAATNFDMRVTREEVVFLIEKINYLVPNSDIMCKEYGDDEDWQAVDEDIFDEDGNIDKEYETFEIYFPVEYEGDKKELIEKIEEYVKKALIYKKAIGEYNIELGRKCPTNFDIRLSKDEANRIFPVLGKNIPWGELMSPDLSEYRGWDGVDEGDYDDEEKVLMNEGETFEIWFMRDSIATVKAYIKTIHDYLKK